MVLTEKAKEIALPPQPSPDSVRLAIDGSVVYLSFERD
jgi:hypothetical protein